MTMQPSSLRLARPSDNSAISTRTLTIALAIVGLGLLVSLLVGDDPSGGWLVAIHASSAIAAFVVWKSARWPDSWSKYLSFGAIILLACVLNRVIYIADILSSGDRVDEFPFYAAEPQMAMRKAELATTVGMILTVFYWLRGGGSTFSPGSLLDNSGRSYVRVLVISYLLSLVGIFISIALPDVMAATGQLVPTMFGLGTAAAFLMPYVLLDSPRARFVMVCVTTAPYIYAALGTGMKENIIVALLPAGYLLWNTSKSLVFKVSIVVVGAMSLALLTAYVNFYRDEVWASRRVMDQSAAVGEFWSTAERDGMFSIATKGLDGFVHRANGGSYRGWAVALADEYRSEPELVFGPIVYVFIPRLFWPDKPQIRQGWEYSALVFGKNYSSFGDSSTSAGLYSGLYLGGGWIAVLVGAAIMGWMMARLARFANRLGGNTLVGLYSFCMLPFALRIDEQWTVGAFSGPLINLAYMYVVFRVANAISGFIGGSQSTTVVARQPS